jgi:K+-sensing histidine kinase KdpD
VWAAATGPHGHGLPVAASVAAAHGGRLLSAPSERGARLVLELPLVDTQGERRIKACNGPVNAPLVE